MKLGHCKGLVDRESYISQYLGLAILTSGVASSIGADDLLACFAAGQGFCSFTTCHCQVSPFERLCNLMGSPLQKSDR